MAEVAKEEVAKEEVAVEEEGEAFTIWRTTGEEGEGEGESTG